MTMNSEPYVQFCSREDAQVVARTDMDNPQQPNNANRGKKKTRGFTQMRGIWGIRESDERLVVNCNDLGQPNDEMATKLSNFIGTLIRDGKNAPLVYASWHKVPQEYKDKMWKILQTKFELHDSSKTWTMQKFGKKLRDWRNQLKRKCYKPYLSLEDQMELKDPRVYNGHFVHLLNYWSTSRAKEISLKNKISRGRRFHNHTTGTKSFARVAKEQAEKLDRVPTRAELFKLCFTKKDGTKSTDVETAIALMQQKEIETPTDPTEVISRNDSFAQVMGKDKNGKVRMFGGGVCPSDVFKDSSSRGANQRSIIKSLEDQNNQLRNEVQQLKSQALYVPRHEDMDSDATQAPDDLSPIIQVANRDIWSLSMPSGSSDRTAQIGDIVCLKSIIRPTQTIAIGILYSTDPSREVGGQELGDEHWEVYIQAVLKPNERLIRSCGRYTSIGDAAGDYIAWPKCFTILKEIDDARGHESWTVRG